MFSSFDNTSSRLTRRNMNRTASLKFKVSPVAVAIISATLVALAWQATFVTGLYMVMRNNASVLLALLLIVPTVFRGRALNRSYIYDLIVLSLLALIVCMAVLEYETQKNIYQHTAVVSQPKNDKATVSEYKYRAPLVVAEDQISSNININGAPEETTYIPSMDRFGTAVRKNGSFAGYGQVVFQQIGANGQSINAKGQVGNQNCSFNPKAKLRFGGALSANLKRAIIHKNSPVLIDEGDSYAYCDTDGTAMLIAPLKKITGFFHPYEVPAGIAVYNGSTGELKIVKDVKEGEYPGPVYPVSLAKQARNSTKASGTLWQYWQNQVGYSDTTGDSNDPNYANAGEFNLRRADNSGDDYVTPLVMKGRGSAITAVGTVASNKVTAGQLNKYTINVLPQARNANSAVASDLQSKWAPTVQWANLQLRVFEIAPTGPNTWTATLGKDKNILYRVTINPDSSSCLFDTKGNKLKCISASGEVTGDTASTDNKTTAPSTGSTSDITKMTDDQLIDLQQKINAEIANRLKKK